MLYFPLESSSFVFSPVMEEELVVTQMATKPHSKIKLAGQMNPCSVQTGHVIDVNPDVISDLLTQLLLCGQPLRKACQVLISRRPIRGRTASAWLSLDWKSLMKLLLAFNRLDLPAKSSSVRHADGS